MAAHSSEHEIIFNTSASTLYQARVIALFVEHLINVVSATFTLSIIQMFEWNYFARKKTVSF